MKKKFILPTTLILGIIAVALLSVSYVSAQDSGDYPSIVQKIAEKFSLNEEDVQAVFDEERDEHHAEMQARWSERLDDQVNSGAISTEQKQAILDKHEELHNQMLELKDLDPEERHQKMQEIHEEFNTWSEEQGIDLPLMGSRMGFGEGFKAGHMMRK